MTHFPTDETASGNCHCGGYRFQLPKVDWASVTTCDCGLCSKQGFLWLPLGDAVDSVHVTRDDGDLISYTSSTLTQKFCRICGTAVSGEHSSGRLAGRTAVNVRALRGSNPFDYEPREPKKGGKNDDAQASLPQQGSCHCGKVTVRLLKPLEDLEVKEDNCSICTRNAWVGIYPAMDQVALTGVEHTTDYRFGRKFNGSPFCSTCGVHVYQNLYGPPQHVVDKLPEQKQMAIKRMLDIKPVNIRVLDHIDLCQLQVNRSDEGTDGYEETVLGEVAGQEPQ